MIYLFSGDDAKRKILNYEKFIKTISVDVETFFINRNNFDRIQIESLYSGASLFAVKHNVVFSGVFDYEETRDFILEKLELMGESNSSFIFLEGKNHAQYSSNSFPGTCIVACQPGLCHACFLCA